MGVEEISLASEEETTSAIKTKAISLYKYSDMAFFKQ